MDDGTSRGSGMDEGSSLSRVSTTEKLTAQTTVVASMAKEKVAALRKIGGAQGESAKC